MNNRLRDDDDDYPPISRELLVKLAALAAQVEEAGGVTVLSDGDARMLKEVSRVMSLPGVLDYLMAQHERHRRGQAVEHERHLADVYWQKIRARWFRIVSASLAVLAAVATALSQFDGAIKTVRAWLKSITG